jgi:hypothetical protein
MSVDWLRRIWIAALLTEKPRNITDTEFLNLLWDVKRRQICAYRALREFQIPGLFLEGGVHPVEGITAGRRIIRGQLVYARKADDQPYYDLEFGDSVFRLTQREWKSVEASLRKAQGNVEIA